MIKTKEETRQVYVVDKVVCNKCKKELDPLNDMMEYQEMLHIDFIGGFESVFGDENHLSADFCQNCVKEILGEYLEEITEKNS